MAQKRAQTLPNRTERALVVLMNRVDSVSSDNCREWGLHSPGLGFRVRVSDLLRISELCFRISRSAGQWRRHLCGWLVLLVLTGCATAPHGSKDIQEIYDPHASGEQLLTAALSQAQKQGKRVLLDLGANWCSDSQAMAWLLQSDPAIHLEVQRHFILVMVDVNQNNGANRNPELIARFGNPIGRGIPVLLILAPDGTLLNRDPAERLRDDAHRAPETVLAYLRKWAPPPPAR